MTSKSRPKLFIRNCSARSDAFGPKIVSADNLPGTPMDHRSSLEEDLDRTPTADGELPHYYLNGSSTKLVVKNERRRSLDFVNRPPSPSFFIQHASTKIASTFNESESPVTSPKQAQHPNGLNKITGKEGQGDEYHSQEGLNNGKLVQNSSSVSNNNGRSKEEKEVITGTFLQ